MDSPDHQSGDVDTSAVDSSQSSATATQPSSSLSASLSPMRAEFSPNDGVPRRNARPNSAATMDATPLSTNQPTSSHSPNSSYTFNLHTANDSINAESPDQNLNTSFTSATSSHLNIATSPHLCSSASDDEDEEHRGSLRFSHNLHTISPQRSSYDSPTSPLSSSHPSHSALQNMPPITLNEPCHVSLSPSVAIASLPFADPPTYVPALLDATATTLSPAVTPLPRYAYASYAYALPVTSRQVLLRDYLYQHQHLDPCKHIIALFSLLTLPRTPSLDTLGHGLKLLRRAHRAHMLMLGVPATGSGSVEQRSWSPFVFESTRRAGDTGLDTGAGVGVRRDTEVGKRKHLHQLLDPIFARMRGVFVALLRGIQQSGKKIAKIPGMSDSGSHSVRHRGDGSVADQDDGNELGHSLLQSQSSLSLGDSMLTDNISSPVPGPENQNSGNSTSSGNPLSALFRTLGSLLALIGSSEAEAADTSGTSDSGAGGAGMLGISSLGFSLFGDGTDSTIPSTHASPIPSSASASTSTSTSMASSSSSSATMATRPTRAATWLGTQPSPAQHASPSPHTSPVLAPITWPLATFPILAWRRIEALACLKLARYASLVFLHTLLGELAQVREHRKFWQTHTTNKWYQPHRSLYSAAAAHVSRLVDIEMDLVKLCGKLHELVLLYDRAEPAGVWADGQGALSEAAGQWGLQRTQWELTGVRGGAASGAAPAGVGSGNAGAGPGAVSDDGAIVVTAVDDAVDSVGDGDARGDGTMLSTTLCTSTFTSTPSNVSVEPLVASDLGRAPPAEPLTVTSGSDANTGANTGPNANIIGRDGGADVVDDGAALCGWRGHAYAHAHALTDLTNTDTGTSTRANTAANVYSLKRGVHGDGLSNHSNDNVGVGGGVYARTGIAFEGDDGFDDEGELFTTNNANAGVAGDVDSNTTTSTATTNVDDTVTAAAGAAGVGLEAPTTPTSTSAHARATENGDTFPSSARIPSFASPTPIDDTDIAAQAQMSYASTLEALAAIYTLYQAAPFLTTPAQLPPAYTHTRNHMETDGDYYGGVGSVYDFSSTGTGGSGKDVMGSISKLRFDRTPRQRPPNAYTRLHAHQHQRHLHPHRIPLPPALVRAHAVALLREEDRRLIVAELLTRMTLPNASVGMGVGASQHSLAQIHPNTHANTYNSGLNAVHTNNAPTATLQQGAGAGAGFDIGNSPIMGTGTSGMLSGTSTGMGISGVDGMATSGMVSEVLVLPGITYLAAACPLLPCSSLHPSTSAPTPLPYMAPPRCPCELTALARIAVAGVEVESMGANHDVDGTTGSGGRITKDHKKGGAGGSVYIPNIPRSDWNTNPKATHTDVFIVDTLRGWGIRQAWLAERVLIASGKHIYEKDRMFPDCWPPTPSIADLFVYDVIPQHSMIKAQQDSEKFSHSIIPELVFRNTLLNSRIAELTEDERQAPFRIAAIPNLTTTATTTTTTSTSAAAAAAAGGVVLYLHASLSSLLARLPPSVLHPPPPTSVALYPLLSFTTHCHTWFPTLPPVTALLQLLSSPSCTPITIAHFLASMSTHLDRHVRGLRAKLHDFAIPPIYSRYLEPILLSVAALGVCVYQIVTHHEEAREALADIAASARHFYHEHIDEPLRNIYKRVFSAFFQKDKSGKPGDETTRLTVHESRVELSKMLYEFGRSHAEDVCKVEGIDLPTYMDTLRERADRGDMNLVMHKYTADVLNPMSGLAKGSLISGILIQVQKLKADGEEAMLDMEQIMEQNEINFNVMATMPAVMVAGGALYAANRTVNNVLRKHKNPTFLLQELRETMHKIEALLITGEPKEDDIEDIEVDRRLQQATWGWRGGCTCVQEVEVPAVSGAIPDYVSSMPVTRPAAGLGPTTPALQRHPSHSMHVISTRGNRQMTAYPTLTAAPSHGGGVLRHVESSGLLGPGIIGLQGLSGTSAAGYQHLPPRPTQKAIRTNGYLSELPLLESTSAQPVPSDLRLADRTFSPAPKFLLSRAARVGEPGDSGVVAITDPRVRADATRGTGAGTTMSADMHKGTSICPVHGVAAAVNLAWTWSGKFDSRNIYDAEFFRERGKSGAANKGGSLWGLPDSDSSRNSTPTFHHTHSQSHLHNHTHAHAQAQAQAQGRHTQSLCSLADVNTQNTPLFLFPPPTYSYHAALTSANPIAVPETLPGISGIYSFSQPGAAPLHPPERERSRLCVRDDGYILLYCTVMEDLTNRLPQHMRSSVIDPLLRAIGSLKSNEYDTAQKLMIVKHMYRAYDFFTYRSR